jgi:serine/threonine-protein kinase
MSSLDGERWKLLSPHLDHALEIAPHERGPWLEALAVRDPSLAADLRRLLDEYQLVGAGRFLEQGAGVFPPSTSAGQTVGAYTLESLVGEGGMGSVWRARRSDGRFEGQVAVKFLRAASIGPTAAARFRREGSILARLTHPSIAHLLDAGVTCDGQPYLVLEYIEGEHIDRYCDRLALTVEQRIRLFLDVLSAVSHAHGHLVVHRDVKPSNVLVRPDGQLKLVDFGIAKLLEAEEEATGGDATALTRDGDRAMTPHFAAPEQVTGQPITTSTDIYSLGVLLFALLSGRRPFDDAQSPLALLRAVVETDAPRLPDAATGGGDAETGAAQRGTTTARLRRDLKGDLDIIVRCAMKKSPPERYRSVDAFADDLRRYLKREPIRARADSLSYRAVKMVQRHRGLAAVSALAIAATVGGLGIAVWQANEARQQRDRALQLLARSDAMTEFFQFLLNDAGPPDQTMTIGAMLARSESLLNNEFGANPEHQAAILGVQAGYYATLGVAADAEARLTRARSLVRATTDADLRATLDCLHGYVLSQLGKEDEGVRAIDQALAVPALSPQVVASCYQSRAYIAQNQLDGAAADTFALAAQQALSTASRPYPSVEASVLADRGYAQQILGRLDEANRLYSQAIEKLTALGRERTPAALAIRNNWGIAILSSGDIQRALAVYEDAIVAAQARDKDSAPPAFLTANLARTLELAGRADEALKLFEEAERVARVAARKDSLAFALLGQASVHVELGNTERAEALIEEVRAALGGSIPKGPPAVTVMSLNGRIALLRGRLDVAQPLLREVVAANVRQGRANPAAVMARLSLAEIALRSKQPAEAAALAQQALDEAQALQGGIRYSNRTGMSYLALAEARLAGGNETAARQSLTSALEHLLAALGPDHPATRRAVALEARMAAAR